MSLYLLMGMKLCCRDFHVHTQLLHVGGSLYNFFVVERFVNPVHNPACPEGGLFVWNGLQGAEDVG